MRANFEGYKEMRRLASELNRWDDLRRQIIASLKKGKAKSLLVEIYLDEDEIDLALEEVKSERTSGLGYAYGFGGSSMKLQVAKAAEKPRPRAALEIYRQSAESLINQRGRENYREACKHLTKVRALYEKLNEGKSWTNYIAKLREDNRSLRALMEELSAAKL